MEKWSIAVFTAWPDLITDQHQQFDITFKDSCQQLIKNTFASDNVSDNLARYVAWTHDRTWHREFDFCLFVNRPIKLDLSDFVTCIGQTHTTYLDPALDFVFYQPGSVWSMTTVHVEKSPNPVGIIFIDCWQALIDQQTWPNSEKDFDFFHNLKQQLLRYKVTSFVFHTNNCGELPLAQDLVEWQQSSGARNIESAAHFEQHYQAIKLFDWIVVGAHWLNCTHDRPLGFGRLLKQKHQDPRLRVYSLRQGTVKFLNNDLARPQVSTCEEQDYDNDRLIWQKNGNLFELIGSE